MPEKICDKCRYWSDLVAQYSHELNAVIALCLAQGSDAEGEMTSGKTTCDKWKHNGYGAIDSPSYAGEYETRDCL